LNQKYYKVDQGLTRHRF